MSNIPNLSDLADQLKRTQEAALRSLVMAAASKKGFNDPGDAWQLLDRASLKLSDDGTVQGLEAALGDLARRKPYLTAQGSNVLTQDKLAAMSVEQIAAKWNDPGFQAQMRVAVSGSKGGGITHE